MLAARMSRVGVSPTMQVAAEADRLRRQGVDVVDLGAGEPDFPTPDHVKAAGRAAIDANFTKYTVNAGIPELRSAICARYRADYGVDYAEAEVLVTAGGKQALYNAAMALFGPGDEVITHTPGWPTIVEQIRLAEATPVLVRARAEDGFSLRADPFLQAMTPATKGIVINSPCNPTGALMEEPALAAIAEEAVRRGIWMVLDLCYEHLIYDPAAHNLPGILAGRARDRAVIAGSASKAYSMTGWRCGWALGPKPLISEYRGRRDLVWALLTADRRIRCIKPAGAFYLFLDISDLLSPDGIRTSAEFAQALLADARVALTAGEAFDAPGFVRISYATSTERLREAAARIHRFVQALDRGERVAAATP
jgi:aspartate aminotransferase